MDTLVQTEDSVRQKTRELCETIVQQPEFQSIRQQMNAFTADPQAQQQYESLTEKGRFLHHKQQQGLELDKTEIAAFDGEREAFFRNPVAKGFVDAQESMHQMQEEVQQWVSKTFELGRVPTTEDMESGGSCGSGCGCHH
jgi:cell fate (sporulation/competence/biofilm development) regulator YlbF (YheA/YmcA/DUF963 family)